MELTFYLPGLSKTPPESAHGTRVDGLINPDDANTTHSHGSTILAANLEVLLLSVAHNTFPFFFFLRVYGPTGDDSQVTPVINRMPAVLIQF